MDCFFEAKGTEQRPREDNMRTNIRDVRSGQTGQLPEQGVERKGYVQYRHAAPNTTNMPFSNKDAKTKVQAE